MRDKSLANPGIRNSRLSKKTIVNPALMRQTDLNIIQETYEDAYEDDRSRPSDKQLDLESQYTDGSVINLDNDGN